MSASPVFIDTISEPILCLPCYNSLSNHHPPAALALAAAAALPAADTAAAAAQLATLLELHREERARIAAANQV